MIFKQGDRVRLIGDTNPERVGTVLVDPTIYQKIYVNFPWNVYGNALVWENSIELAPSTKVVWQKE
jgi:hypothetical protein